MADAPLIASQPAVAIRAAVPDDFDAIPARIRKAGIPYRSSVHGPVDSSIDTQHGGRIVYWNQPDGHQWEMLTVSHARREAFGEGSS